MEIDPLNKVAKWRTVFAGWIWGTELRSDPGNQGKRDLMEKVIVYRVELSALAALLIKKGVFTHEEFRASVDEEATRLDKMYEALFPGFSTFGDGVKLDPRRSADTMRNKGFPL
jgi:hypothetical protein